MNSTVIIDIVAAAVLAGFMIFGIRRGLFRSVAGLLIVILALAGAGMIATALTPRASAYLQPYIEKRVEARIDAALSDSSGAASSQAASAASSADSSAQTEKKESSGLLARFRNFIGAGESGESSADSQVAPVEPSVSSSESANPAGLDEPDGTPALTDLSVGRLLSLLGLDDSLSDALASSAQEKVRETGVSVMTAVAESVAETVVHILLFLISFAVLLLLLKLVMHAIDLVLKLPVLHFFNRLGGAVFGIAEGALVLFLAVWVLRRLGVSFNTDTVKSTYLLHFFTTHTPLDMLSFL